MKLGASVPNLSEINLTNNLKVAESNHQPDLWLPPTDTSRWRQAKGSQLGFGYTNKDFYIRSVQPITVPEQGPYVLLVHSPHINEITFQIYENGVKIKECVTGVKYPFLHREGSNRYFTCTFNTRPNAQYKIQVKAHNNFGSLNVRLRLMQQQAFEAFYEFESFVILSFLALLLVATIVSLFLWFVFKDAVYGLYAGYVGSWMCARAVIFGFFYKYFHPDFPYFVDVSKAFFILTAAICLLGFVPRLMFASHKAPYWLIKTLQAQQALYALLAMYTLIPYKPEPFSSMLIHVMNANFVLSIALVGYLSVLSFKLGTAPGRLFSISFIPLLCIMVVTIGSNIGIIPNSFFTQYPVEIGLSIEFVFLALALAKRYALIVNQKEHLEQQLMTLQSQKSMDTTRTERYVNSKLSDDILEAWYQKIRTHVEQHKSYLNSELSLTSLANELQTSPHTVSQVINQRDGKHFSDFVNAYRIQHACQLLQSKSYNKYSIEGIGLESGFNTKATFYHIFKKYMKKTPAEFRKEADSEASYTIDLNPSRAQ